MSKYQFNLRKIISYLKSRNKKSRIQENQLAHTASFRLPLKKIILVIFVLFVVSGALSAYLYRDQLQQYDFKSLLSFDHNSNKKLLDVIAIADFSGPTKMIGSDLALGFEDAVRSSKISDDIRLIVRDDRGNPNVDSALADGAASGFSTLAVIGPSQSIGYEDFALSLEEGMVPGILPIAPPSSSNNKKWIFALQPSQERQGEFIGRLLLKQKPLKKIAFVALSGKEGGSYLSGVEKSLGKESKDRLQIKKIDANDDDEKISSFVRSLLSFDTVVLSVPTAQARDIIKGLKDSRFGGVIIGFGGASLSSFPEQFKDFPKEKLEPGFYTNGVFSVAPYASSMTSEGAGKLAKLYEKKYGGEPSWAYAYGYDSGILLAKFLEQESKDNPLWREAPPEETRERFKKFLASTSAGKILINGFTGDVRFDKNQERDIPPILVVYHNRIQTPYFLQYGSAEARFNLSDDLGLNQVQVDERIYDLVPVVFTGINIREISEIDIDKREFAADLDIWFRSNVPIDEGDLVFPNEAGESIKLTKLETVNTGSEKYSLFRVKGKFHFSASAKDLVLGKLNLPFEWRHKNLDASKLRFVIDPTQDSKKSIDGQSKSNLVNADLGYASINAVAAVENIQVNSLGNPATGAAVRRFSEAREQLDLISTKTRFGAYFARHFSPTELLIISAVLAIFAVLPKLFKKRFTDYRRLQTGWLLIVGLSAIFFGQIGMFASPILDSLEGGSLLFIQNSFIGLYFFIVAATINLFISWKINQNNSKNSALQGSLKIFMMGLVYFLFFAVYYTDTLKKDLLPVLATSSVALTVIGLAMREIILDALGGITLGVDSAIKVGDWIHIKTNQQNLYGTIEQLGWRNVRIHSRDDMVHFIPNSTLLNYVVSNASLKGGYTRFDVKFEISSSTNLEHAIELVATAVSNLLAKNEYIDHKKAIRVVCEEINSEGAKMIAQVYYKADQSRDSLKTKVLETVNQVLGEINALPSVSIQIADRKTSDH